jgi:hypothetical protein
MKSKKSQVPSTPSRAAGGTRANPIDVQNVRRSRGKPVTHDQNQDRNEVAYPISGAVPKAKKNNVPEVPYHLAVDSSALSSGASPAMTTVHRNRRGWAAAVTGVVSAARAASPKP